MPRQRDRQSAPAADPALEALAQAPRDRPVVLLHSGRPHRRWASRSLLAQPVAWFRHTADGRSEMSDVAGGLSPVNRRFTHDVWRDLRLLLNHPALPGKWFGYIAYDIARFVEPHKLAHTQRHPWPVVELGYCPQVQIFKPRTPRSEAPDSLNLPSQTPRLVSNFTRPEYEAAVQRALDYIAAGDIFQVNLAQRFTTTHTGDPRKLFARLAAISPAWFGAYVECGMRNGEGGLKPPHGSKGVGGDQAPRPAGDHLPHRALLSTSPELFLRVEDRRVITRPIKGTLEKLETRNPQLEIAQLLASEKDTAELNMIVDLLRNDLGRVCAYGSVRVENPREIETHPTIHHATATLTGELHPRKDVVDLLRAVLPGGSITGAPKVRAMQIIDELEPDPRGSYCGCIGYLSKDQACLNIAIRTMMLERRDRPARPGLGEPSFDVSFSVGGGIVADSVPADEYDETLAKALAIRRALGTATA